MKGAIRDASSLRQTLRIVNDNSQWIEDPDFPVFVPHSYLKRMQPGDTRDPLLLQVAPRVEEEIQVLGYQTDPLSERSASIAPGVLQKYHGRALLVVTGACAVHCRYCFRRHFPYLTDRAQNLDQLLDPIRADRSVTEVILSGGDPLTLSDSALIRLIGAVEEIPHVDRLRIHTRLPVVIPSRVTRQLLTSLTETTLSTVVVLHFNHPNELSDDVALATRALNRVADALLNQSVLLNDVNNNVETLVELSQKMMSAGVLPYYLHVPDKVAGTAHFDVPLEEAKALFAVMQKRLPGYLVPRLVREVPGAPAKELLLGDSVANL